MAIQFRCNYCKSLLGISDSQAGAVVDCPRCGRSQKVPGQSVRPAEGSSLPDLQLQQALSELSDLNSATATQHGSSARLSTDNSAAIPVLLIDGLRDDRRGSKLRNHLSAAAQYAVTFASGLIIGIFNPFTNHQKQPILPLATADQNPVAAMLNHQPPDDTSDRQPGQQQWPDRTLSGHVRYIRNGEHPDVGALVILLPLKNPTPLRFSAAALHTGPADPAWLATAAAMHELNADISQTDASGAFQFKSCPDVPCTLLVISRHSPRPAGVDIPQEFRETAQQWFDSVSGLAGRLSIQRQDIATDSSVPLIITLPETVP